MKTDSIIKSDEQITRKEALIKTSKYAAFTAAAAIILLVPKRAQAQTGGGGTQPYTGDGIAPTGRGWGTNGGISAPQTGSSSSTKSSPFTKPEQSSSKSGRRDSPWQ